MPKIRPRSTNKAQWSSDTLSKAEDLIKQGYSMRYAAKAMNIPFSSLQKRLKKKDSSEPRLGRLPIFTGNAEKILADRIKYLAKILTSTPVKDSLVEKENRKAAKEAKGKNIVPKSKSKKQKPQKKVANKAKRRILQEQNTSSESDISLNKICDDDEDDDLNDCLVCGEFGRNNEEWYRCTSCGLWAHAECTGWDSPQGYVCDNC